MRRISPLPFSSEWFRFRTVTPKIEKIQIIRQGRVEEIWRESWILDYSGGDYEKKTYPPNYEVVIEALRLHIPVDREKEPTAELLKFLKERGPLGFIYEPNPYWNIGYRGIRKLCLQNNEKINNDPDLKKIEPVPRPLLYYGYSEPVYWIYTELQKFQEAFRLYHRDNDYSLINRGLARVETEPALNDSGEFVFPFTSLRDALYLILANRIAGGAVWKVCQGCGNFFDRTMTDQRAYCSEDCRLTSGRAKLTLDRQAPLIKAKRAYLQRLSRREISDKTKTTIVNQIRKAESQVELEALEAKYRVLHVQKRGPKK